MSEATEGTRISELQEAENLEENDGLVIVRRNPVTGDYENFKAPLPARLTAAEWNKLLARLEKLEQGAPDPGPQPADTGTSWIGLSDDQSIDAAELTVSSLGKDSHALRVPEIAHGDRKYIVYGRPASEGAFKFVHYYIEGRRDNANRINAWTALPGVVTKDGVDLTVIVTRGPYRGPIGDPGDPNTHRIVEAG